MNGIEWHIIHLDNPKIMNILGVKYYIVYDEDELPANYSFEYAYNLNHLKVFFKKDYKGFAYTLPNVDYSSNINSIDDFEETLFVDSNNIDIDEYGEGAFSRLDIYERGNNYFKGTIKMEKDNILFVSIPYNKGWKVIDNGKEVDSIRVNGGFLGVELDSGLHDIQLYFRTFGLKLGAMLSLVGIMGAFVIFLFERKNNV